MGKLAEKVVSPSHVMSRLMTLAKKTVKSDVVTLTRFNKKVSGPYCGLRLGTTYMGSP